MRLSFIIVLIAATFVIVAFAANEDDINHDITDQDHKHNHHEHEHHDHLEHDEHKHYRSVADLLTVFSFD